MKNCMVIFDRLLALSASVAGVLLLFLVVSVSLSVILRYALNYTLLWLFDVTELLLVLICFLLATWVLRREGHVRMDIVISRLKPRVQHTLNGVTSILMALMCLAVVWYSASNSFTHFQMRMHTREIITVPTGVLDALLAIGSLALFIQFVRRMNRCFRMRTSSEMSKSGK